MSAQLSYYYKNRERILQQQKLYYQNNKHNVRQYQKKYWGKYYEDNREYCIKRNLKYKPRVYDVYYENPPTDKPPIEKIEFILDFGEF